MFEIFARKVNLSGSADVARRIKDRLYAERVIFVHVPKCGGTSLSHMLRARYALSYAKVDEPASSKACAGLDKNDWFDFKRRLAGYHAAKGAHFVQGHFCVDRSFIDAHARRYKIITVLREPVDRFVSHYYFDKRYNHMPFDEYADSSHGLTEGRVLCHFFGELPWNAPPDRARADDAVATALANLDALAVVGRLEDPERMDADFERAVGFRPKVAVRNVGKTRQRRDGLTPAQMERAADLCADDARIYAAIAGRSAPIDDTPNAHDVPGG